MGKGFRICVSCLIEKPLDFFYKHNRLKDGLFKECKECNKKRARAWISNNRGRSRSYAKIYREKQDKTIAAIKRKKYYDENKKSLNEKRRNKHYVEKYGFTVEHRNLIYRQQKGLCAICFDFYELNGIFGLLIDHCHKTNKVRAMLCQRCNQVLGKVNDDVAILDNMKNYLLKHAPELSRLIGD